MNKRLFTLGFAILLALYAMPISAQGNGWRVESIQPLSKLLEGIVTPEKAFPAPDGVQIAYEKKLEGENPSSVCARNLITNEDRCIELPPPQHLHLALSSFFVSQRWSPDSQRIALVGLAYVYFQDTDLGLADLTTLTLTNLAEDNFTGSLLPPMPDGAAVEAQPAWSPDGTQIAVERAVVSDQGKLWQARISIFDVSEGSVRDLTLLPGHEIYTVDAGTVASLDWSPDGKTLAVAVRHPKFEPDYDGIWLVDAASGKLTRLVSFEQALPAVQQVYPNAGDAFETAPISWSPDGSRLMFWSGPQDTYASQQWVFWVEIASGKITPLSLPTDPQNTSMLRTIWPSHAIWSPDGSQLLIVAKHAAAPDTTGATILSTSEGSESWSSFHLIDVATGEDTLLGYVSSAASVPQIGVWSPDRNVIGGGYSLKLAQ